MKRFAWVVGVLAIVPACGDDDTCEPKPLAEFCRGAHCPSGPAEAIKLVCERDGGPWSGEWLESANSCGGTTIESATGPNGVIYYFDHAGKLVAGTGWSDTTNGPCSSFDTNYGKKCEPGKHTTNDCPSAP
jgi:hypothetical protein